MSRGQFSWNRVLGIALLASLEAGAVWAGEKYGHLEDQMEKVHKGRRSPYKQTQEQVAKDAPAWDVINKQLPAFESMSRALKESRNAEVKDASDGYATAIDDLAAAAKKQDLTAARTAMKHLSNACADCHFKGGPGGQFEREHEQGREHSGQRGHRSHGSGEHDRED